MSDTAVQQSGLDLTYVEDPQARRALRTIHQTLSDAQARQQLQLDAMLQMVIEKNVGSLGDFKRHLLKLQQNTALSDRIHDAIAAAHMPVIKSVPKQL